MYKWELVMMVRRQEAVYSEYVVHLCANRSVNMGENESLEKVEGQLEWELLFPVIISSRCYLWE